jgi:hypothetical protein
MSYSVILEPNYSPICMIWYFGFLFTFGLILLMVAIGHIRKKKNTKKIILAIIILFLVTLISNILLMALPINSNNGGSDLYGISIYLVTKRSDIKVSDLGFDNDSKENLTNHVFNLEITVFEENTNQTILCTWHRVNETSRDILYLISRNEGIRINKPKIDYEYRFVIRFVFESNDPDIMNHDLNKENKTLSGFFSISKKWILTIILDETYQEDAAIIDNETIKMPLKLEIRIRPEIKYY